MITLIFSSDNSPKRLQPGDYVLNSSSGEIRQMTPISSAIFGNDEHLIKVELIGELFMLEGEIIGAQVNAN